MPSYRSDGRRRNSGRITSQSRRPAQARGGGRDQRYRSTRNYRTIRGTDTGYNLRRNNVTFGGRKGGLVGRLLSDPVLAVALLVALVLLVVIVFGLVSCVRGCVAGRSGGDRSTVNEQDERIAAGVSSELSSELTAALDRNEQLATIAAHAADYDARLVELALTEPDAVSFVATYPTMEHAGGSYDAEVEVGEYVALYCWDQRWGAVDFADGPLAVTGSGPVALSMASMGLSGKTDLTPADVAQAIDDAGGTDSSLGMSASYLEDGDLEALGLKVKEIDTSADSLASEIEAGSVVLARVGDETSFGTRAHWLLIPLKNSDATLRVFDPTSVAAGTHPWAASTVAEAADGLYVLTLQSAESSDDGQESS